MPDPICTYQTLVEANPCLSGEVFTERDQKYLQVYFNVLELAALGGFDYSAVLDSTLINDAVQLADTMNLSHRRTATLAIHRNNAINAGATVPTDPDELKDAIKCMENYNLDPNALILLLLCRLGSHAAFPQ